MKLLAPDLFERRFGDLMEIGRARLPDLAPEWTDHNAHDPGITLMELLAWVAEAQLYSLARRPRRDEREAYAALLGFAPAGTRPARGIIWPNPGASLAVESTVIPGDAVIHVAGEPAPEFRPVQQLLYIPGRIQRLETRLANGGIIDHTATNARGATPFLPFGETAGPRDVLALTFRPSSVGGVRPQPHLTWGIGVRAAGSSAGGSESEGSSHTCRATLTATLVAGAKRVPLEIVSDTTNGLLTTGALLLNLDGVPAQELTIELRAPKGFARPPRWLRFEPNVIPIVQGRAVARELHEPTGQPDWSFPLDLPGLRFAAGDEPVQIEVDELAGLHVWERTDHLSDHGPDDRVFALDARRAEVAFGNGLNGRIPPVDAQVLASYAVCDAERGNVARNRSWRVAPFAGAYGVNLDPVTGGAPATDGIEQRRAARLRAREEHALVSSDDLAQAAKALPLLEVARAWVLPPRDDAPRTGTVTLVAMRARVNGKEPAQVPETRRWLDAVRRQLLPRIPLGTRLAVTAPRYIDFSLRATVVTEAGRDPAVIQAAIERELAKRLSLTGRKPGVPVTNRDVSAWLRGVEGVGRIAELRLIRANGQQDDDIDVVRGGLPRLDLSRSTIEVRRP
ncbi:MAG TPA: putative baseplate assembly protein [Thermoanaerobaculia bacterium]|nr:putative baseplate assembly protein [Thermoanaerobaculia bacterium]